MMCPVRPVRRGDDYRGATVVEWNQAVLLMFSVEREWKGARRFWLALGGLNELNVQLEALAYVAYHNIHEPVCQATDAVKGS